MKKLSTLMGCAGLLAMLCAPLSASAHSSEADSTRRSLVEYLAKKEMPRSINVDLHLRAGLNANFPSPTTGEDDVSFRFDQVILAIYGQITDKLSYKYEQRLNRGTRAFETENLSSTIDYAYLEYRFNPRFAITAGRHAILFGGFEFDELPIFINEYSNINGNLTCYLTGVKFTYNPTSTQELAFQVVNNRHGSLEEAYGKLPETVKNPTAPLYYSVGWNSSYCEDRIRMRYAVNTGEQVRGKWAFMISGGHLFRLGKVTTYFDLLYQRLPFDSQGVIRQRMLDAEGLPREGAFRSVEYFDAVGDLNYRFHPKWNLHLKGFYNRGTHYYSDEDLESMTCLSDWGYQGGMEFFPMRDNNMRIYFNVCGRTYSDQHIPTMPAPRDRVRLSLGFAYRLPVL